MKLGYKLNREQTFVLTTGLGYIDYRSILTLVIPQLTFFSKTKQDNVDQRVKDILKEYENW